MSQKRTVIRKSTYMGMLSWRDGYSFSTWLNMEQFRSPQSVSWRDNVVGTAYHGSIIAAFQWPAP